MSESLLSVGLDVGTTTTQMVLSSLQVENKASSFAVPHLEITQRKIIYKSPVYFTPLLSDSLVDGKALREQIAKEYETAGITRGEIATGAIIITGETSRKENAKTVLSSLSDFAGDFVVATAGPDLESVLAAKGAGAVDFSEKTEKTVLHIDIGGGTSNLALIEKGEIVRTGCLNVGGRLIKLSGDGKVTYVSPVLKDLCPIRVGDAPTEQALTDVARLLTDALEMAAGLKPPSLLLNRLLTRETEHIWEPPKEPVILSFSGGVADCIEKDHPAFAFGDMGILLGKAIRKSALCQGDYRLGEHTIRATVIGAGCHSTHLSGSTVFYRNVTLPLKNLPVAVFTEEEQSASDLDKQIIRKIKAIDTCPVVLSLPGFSEPTYEKVTALAKAIVKGVGDAAVFVCLEADMAKALGHSLCLQLPQNIPCLCLDRVQLSRESYLDIGTPVGPCLPVVVKTLVLSN